MCVFCIRPLAYHCITLFGLVFYFYVLRASILTSVLAFVCVLHVVRVIM